MLIYYNKVYKGGHHVRLGVRATPFTKNERRAQVTAQIDLKTSAPLYSPPDETHEQ